MKNLHRLSFRLFILFGLFFFTQPLHAAGDFPTGDVPAEQQIKTDKKSKRLLRRAERFKKKFSKKVRKLKKKGKRFFSKERSSNLYGNISIWTFIGALVLGFISVAAIQVIVFILWLASLITAIIGVMGGDENPKRAKVMLIIHVSVILLAILFLGFIAIIFGSL